MSGIAGYIGRGVLSDEKIHQTLAGMGHSERDSTGYQRFLSNRGCVALLHRGLNLTDLDQPESVKQPLSLGGHWLAFHGELYNYLALKTILEEEGHQFHTQSDSEVMLRILLTEGWEGLARCEGMWALAYYDDSSGSLWLCRDRFGKKPLYVYRGDGGLHFSSEIKWLSLLLSQPLRVNHEHLKRYLVNGPKSLYKTDQTFFYGVEEVSPGTALRLQVGKPDQRYRYWTPQLSQNHDLSYSAVVSTARDKLLRAMECRLSANMPLAFCLNGDVSSQALIAISKQEFNADVHGFTLVNSNNPPKKPALGDVEIKSLGINHTEVPLDTGSFLQNLQQLIRRHDGPVSSMDSYTDWLWMRAVREEGYRISVSGIGADELFSGYFDHHLAYLYQVQSDYGLFTKSLTHWRAHIQSQMPHSVFKQHDLFINNPQQREHIYLDNTLFSEFLEDSWIEAFHEFNYSEDVLRNRMLNEMFHETVPVVLHEGALNAAGFSLENRLPFLDKALFDFCVTIPTPYLIKKGQTKAVLRDAMRGYLPDTLLDSQCKVGFNAPIGDFLDLSDKRIQQILLADSPVFDIVRRDKIRHLVTEPLLSTSHSKFLFSFINAKFFLESFEQ